MGEQSKALKRRFNDGNFTTRYFVGDGIDIGGKADPLNQYTTLLPAIKSVRTWDLEDGDGQYLESINDNSYDFLVSSHCLEHLEDVHIGLKNWIRIVKPGGYLVITVPDEDLYEIGHWPSLFNSDHKWTFTIHKSKSWSPKSINVLDLIIENTESIVVEKICQINEFFREQFVSHKIDQTRTPVAECCIEIILRKK